MKEEYTEEEIQAMRDYRDIIQNGYTEGYTNREVKILTEVNKDLTK